MKEDCTVQKIFVNKRCLTWLQNRFEFNPLTKCPSSSTSFFFFKRENGHFFKSQCVKNVCVYVYILIWTLIYYHFKLSCVSYSLPLPFRLSSLTLVRFNKGWNVNFVISKPLFASKKFLDLFVIVWGKIGRRNFCLIVYSIFKITTTIPANTHHATERRERRQRREMRSAVIG